MSSGRLLLGATPLGQPSDASPRLAAALATADVVAAEDTRRVRKLAKALDIRIGGRVVSLFDRVEALRVTALLDAINNGATVLVVSDAGTPVISDPGYRLVAACIDAGVSVTCLPGPSAVTTALVMSGLPAEKFSSRVSPRARVRRAGPGWPNWPRSGAPVFSSNPRAGWLRALTMPSSSSVVPVRRRSAGS